MQEVHSRHFQTIGFGIQRPGADAHGLILLVVTLGVVAHLRGRHLQVAVLQAQLR
ncbi:hypothetical protein D3C76_1182580 [compost metagenome]